MDCSDQNFTLLPSDYLIGPTAASPTLCLSWPKASPPSSDGIDWQIGAAFLRTVYTIFRCVHNGLDSYMSSLGLMRILCVATASSGKSLR